MFKALGRVIGRQTPQKGPPMRMEPSPMARPSKRDSGARPQVYTKVFRWRLADGQTKEPKSVAVVGSFSNWQPVPLVHDGKLDAWHVTIHHIPGNQTHHYVLLVDGKPTYDKTCDGYAVPHGPQEEQYQMTTDKGPRVLMLFAQTK